jgi:hypothetical protein
MGYGGAIEIGSNGLLMEIEEDSKREAISSRRGLRLYISLVL